MSRRKEKKKKARTFFARFFVFIAIFVFAALFFVIREQEQTGKQKTQWQTGCFLRIGDTQVDAREGLVYLNAAKEDYEQYYGSDIWEYVVDAQGNTIAAVLKEQVLEQITYIKVVCEKAGEMGTVLSAEELERVEAQVVEYMKKLEGSPLLTHGVNADIIRRIYSDNLLARKTFEEATLKVNTDIPDEEARQRSFYTLAIRNHKVDASGEKVAYKGEDLTALKERMSKLREEALTKEDFYTWAASITDDASTLKLSGGAGDFPEELEEALFALSTGELSEVIETTDYMYLVYCVYDFDIDATLAVKEEMIAKRQAEEFLLLYEEWKLAIGVELNKPEWEKIDFISGN